jgi:DNA-binding transcriptional LysR family regulator
VDRLKTMETFVSIVKTGNLSETARQLSVSRAIVSRHLQQLEEHLGARLFNRTTRQISLTDIGERYYAFCSKVLSEIEEEEVAVSRQQTQPKGTLRLLASPSFGNMRLGPIVADFLAAYPTIQVSMDLTSYEITDLDKKTFDLAVHLTDTAPDTPLTGRKVGEVRWLLCAAPAYLQKHGVPKRPEDLADHSCLLMHRTDRKPIWTFRRADQSVSVNVAGPLVTNSVMGMRAAVQKGLGISILPMYALKEALADGSVIELLPNYRAPGRSVYALYRFTRYVPNKVRVFIDFLAERLVS